MKKIVLVFCIVSLGLTSLAQTEGVSIAPNVTPPDPSAMLDVQSSNKGILIPRVDLDNVHDDQYPVSDPIEGVMVYNETGDVSKGFYYWDGSKWSRVGACGNSEMTFSEMQGFGVGLWKDDVGTMVYVTTQTMPLVCPDPSGVITEVNVEGFWVFRPYDAACKKWIKLGDTPSYEHPNMFCTPCDDFGGGNWGDGS